MPYKDPEKQREHVRQYDKEHRDEKSAYNKCYRQEHRDELREYDKKYCLLHKDRKKEQSAIRYQNNKQKINQQRKEYQHSHCRELRRAVLKREYGSEERYNKGMEKYDGWCAFGCDRKAFLVHHMDGKSTFNSPREQVNNDLTNLLPLCKSCHSWLHQKKYGRGYRGRWISIKS